MFSELLVILGLVLIILAKTSLTWWLGALLRSFCSQLNRLSKKSCSIKNKKCVEIVINKFYFLNYQYYVLWLKGSLKYVCKIKINCWMCTKLCFLLPPLSLLNHVVLVIWLFLCSVLFECTVLILYMLFVMVKLLNHSNLLLWCPFVVMNFRRQWASLIPVPEVSIWLQP